MNRTIFAHELQPGDLLESSTGAGYFVVSSTPNPAHPNNLRRIKVLLQNEGTFFDYDDVTVDRTYNDKYPFIYGRFLARVKHERETP